MHIKAKPLDKGPNDNCSLQVPNNLVRAVPQMTIFGKNFYTLCDRVEEWKPRIPCYC